ncbi:MAG TPA: PilN domain-containing protein [Thermomonas sp.]|nr:PilN domain-containing protein [Thermomonas sp.]
MRAVFGLAQQRLLVETRGDMLQLGLTLPAQPGEAPVRTLAELPQEAVATAVGDPLARILSPRIAGLPRWLVLPASTGLRRRLTLPAAAADRLRDVLGFEIDRQTPFSADDVHHDARLIGRRGDQLDAELVVVPRAALDQALATLGEPLVATLAGVDIAGPDGLPLGVNLLPGARRRRRRDPRAAWNAGLVVIALAAAGAGLWQIRGNREAAADALEAAVKLRSQKARDVSAQKKELVDLVEGLRFLQQTRNGRPTTVEVLDELTRRLPDDTYVEKVSIEGDNLLIIGLSSQAPQLVEKLQSSKLWHAMNFTGALMPDPTKGKDRFTLVAQLTVSGPAKTDKPARGPAPAETEGAP